uniref:Involucrin-like n=1 Tax=Diabrotica virgifera virgifera TaxID=50390 RepID=A0A6P7GL64_DIAVI
MSITRNKSKENKKQEEYLEQEDIFETTIMASEQQELSGIDKLLQLMQLQSQKMEQKMDDNQQETKQAIEENNKKIEERIEKNEMKIKDHMQEQEMRMKVHMKEQEMKIRNKMEELTNCQKKELENLENKLENAIQVDREELGKRITEIEKKVTENKTQQNFGERRETIIHITEDVKIRFGGDVKKLHPVIFINNLKKSTIHR